MAYTHREVYQAVYDSPERYTRRCMTVLKYTQVVHTGRYTQVVHTGRYTQVIHTEGIPRV